MNANDLAFMIFLVAAAGTPTLLIALEPAWRLAGVPGGVARRLRHAAGLALIAALMTASVMWCLSAVDPAGPDPVFFIGITAPICLAGGLVGGWYAKRTAPLPGIAWRLPLAAGLVAGPSLYAAALANTRLGGRTGFLLGVGAFLTGWVAAPLAAYYTAALAQRRRRKRYDTLRRLPAKNADLHPCHACGRFVPAATGDPCPRCKATIDAACWRCCYDWTGVTDAACPECGGWKASQSGV